MCTTPASPRVDSSTSRVAAATQTAWSLAPWLVYCYYADEQAAEVTFAKIETFSIGDENGSSPSGNSNYWGATTVGSTCSPADSSPYSTVITEHLPGWQVAVNPTSLVDQYQEETGLREQLLVPLQDLTGLGQSSSDNSCCSPSSSRVGQIDVLESGPSDSCPNCLVEAESDEEASHISLDSSSGASSKHGPAESDEAASDISLDSSLGASSEHSPAESWAAGGNSPVAQMECSPARHVKIHAAPGNNPLESGCSDKSSSAISDTAFGCNPLESDSSGKSSSGVSDTAVGCNPQELAESDLVANSNLQAMAESDLAVDSNPQEWAAEDNPLTRLDAGSSYSSSRCPTKGDVPVAAGCNPLAQFRSLMAPLLDSPSNSGS